MYTLVYSFCRKVETLFVLDGAYLWHQVVGKLAEEELPLYSECDCCGEGWKTWQVSAPSDVANMTRVLPTKTVIYYSEVGRFVMIPLAKGDKNA